MYIERVPNRNSPPAVLLRESYRDENGKVRKRTLANVSALPDHAVDALKAALRDGADPQPLTRAGFELEPGIPFGHVAAVLGVMENLKFASLIDPTPSPQRTLALALIASRVLHPASKLATANCLEHILAGVKLKLGLGEVQAEDLYQAMDYLFERQEKIQKRLAQRHLSDSDIVLYDVSSSYYEGTHCPLVFFGYNRDQVKGLPQIVYGLICNPDGIPISVEVFPGNTADPNTVKSQVDRLRNQFDMKRIILVGDRGMLTAARIREDLAPLAVDYLTTLRSSDIKRLLSEGRIAPSLFDQYELFELAAVEEGEDPLVVCLNPLLKEERARKRETLLQASEKLLSEVEQATKRSKNPLRGKSEISVRADRALQRHKMAKHFILEITETSFRYARNQESIQAEAKLDGLYVVRASPGAAEQLTPAERVETYKSLKYAERAFRTFKGLDVMVRPIHHRLEDRVRAHLLLCMLAYHIHWHMRNALAPLLFQDEKPQDQSQGQEQPQPSPVGPAKRSQAALNKCQQRKNPAGYRVQSFHDLMHELSTLDVNKVNYHDPNVPSILKVNSPTPLQQEAFRLLNVQPRL